MADIRCIVVDGKGERCSTTVTVSEPVAAKAQYICKNHPRAVQVRANGREYDPVKDEADKELHFQDHQFDKDLSRSSKPTGTEHIQNQGSDVFKS